jgi:tetratricopeptide (TPR) repeat protein
VDMPLLVFFLLAELNRTSGFIDIPTAPQYEMPGLIGGSVMFSLPLYGEATDPADFDMAIKYGFGRGEVSLSMFTLTTYVASLKYLLVKEKDNVPAVFGGIDDISYSKWISSVGDRAGDEGFIEEYNYYIINGGRPWELLSAYVAVQKSIQPYFNLVLGIGRGRFIGYGPRSRIFNIDYFVLGDEYKIENHSGWAFGMFAGGSVKFPFGLEFIVEMDGRDGNVGIKYHHRYVSVCFAIAKCEHFWSPRPYSPRYTFGIEASNKFKFEAPRFGTIECVVQDITSKELLHNSVVEIKEVNKKYKAVGGIFTLSLPTGNYTITVSKPDYVDYIAKISVKSGTKSKFVFNLNKTAEVLAREAALRAKQENIRNYLEQGKIYLLENKLDPAKVAFEMVLSLDPDNTEAKEHLAQIEPKRAQLIAVYRAEAISRTRANDFAKAIESWQKVLSLDPDHSEAKRSIADLQNRIAAAKKPPTKPTKPIPTKAEIEALYNKGVNLFTAEKYHDALKIFKQVLALNPNHAGAKDYKERTEVRIKILEGG